MWPLPINWKQENVQRIHQNTHCSICKLKEDVQRFPQDTLGSFCKLKEDEKQKFQFK